MKAAFIRMPLLNLPPSSCSEMNTQYSTFCLCKNGWMWFIKLVNCCVLCLYGIINATFCLDLQDFGRKQPSTTQSPAFFKASANGISSRSISWKPIRFGPPRSHRGRLSLGFFETQSGVVMLDLFTMLRMFSTVIVKKQIMTNCCRWTEWEQHCWKYHKRMFRKSVFLLVGFKPNYVSGQGLRFMGLSAKVMDYFCAYAW